MEHMEQLAARTVEFEEEKSEIVGGFRQAL